MVQLIKNCHEYRELLYALSESYIKARYKQTILGVGWAIVPSVLLMLTVIFAFPHIANIAPDMKPYPLFVFIGFWFWTFFANSLAFAIPSLVQNVSLLRKVHFPREILVIAAIVPSILDSALGTLPLFALLLYFKIPLSFSFFLLLILFIIELILILGLSFVGAITNVAFRDVAKFLPITLQILFFATPVIYSINTISTGTYANIYKLNPLAGILDAARSIVLNQTIIHPHALIYASCMSIATCWIGYLTFKAGEKIITDIR